MPKTKDSLPNLLLLSGGSKVAIARIAKKAAKKRGAILHISDTSTQVPSATIADQFKTLPEHGSTDWADKIQKLCIDAKIGLIIPTRHSELLALSNLATKLNKRGTAIALSHATTLTLCIQKLDTYNFLKSIAVPTPASCRKNEFDGQIEFPIIAKPENGSSSIGLRSATTINELEKVPPNWILQEKAKGTEYTTNVYISRKGEVICAIPHERIAVEAGEVVKAKTQRIPQLIDYCSQIAKKLPGAAGIINIQAFFDKNTGKISVIEINPRIGGGYPLCDAAKGHYIEWLCQEYLDQTDLKPFESWTEELLMMRHREAAFSL